MRPQLKMNETLFFSMVWDFLNVYLPNQSRESQKTVKAYADALTVFRRYLTDNLHIALDTFLFRNLTYEFMLDYRDYLVGSSYKPRTVNHRITAIKAYMKYAASRNVSLTQIYLNISDVPIVKVPKTVPKIIEGDDALKSLLNAPKPSDKGIRDQLILVMLYDTALRANELLELKLSDINLTSDTPYIRIHGKGDKERIVGLSEKTIPLIQQYIQVYHPNPDLRTAPFFYTRIKGVTGKMSERNLERIVKKYGDIVRQNGQNVPERIYPHMMRRTRATGWYRDEVPIETIAEVLGHSSVETTRKSYAFPSVEQLRAHMDRGTQVEPDSSRQADVPLWTDDEEFARLCGIR